MPELFVICMVQDDVISMSSPIGVAGRI